MAVPSFSTRFSNGLGRLSQSLFPMDQATTQSVAPDQLQALRSNALMQLGLGMLATSGRGGNFGESALAGYNQAQTSLQSAMQNAYQNASRNRAEQREVEREQRGEARYNNEQSYRIEQDKLAQDRWKTEQATTAEYRKQQADLERERITSLERRTMRERPPDVRQTDRGMMQWDPAKQKWDLVPGTEPTGVSGRPIPQGMANDMKSNASVLSQIDSLLPQLRDQSGNFTKAAKDAFGAGNAVVNMLTPDAISDNVKNFFDSDGTDLRAIVTNLNSYVVKERNGAAVTVAEFARQRGFLPTDSDSEEIIERKLTNLRKAIGDEQQYMLDFAESQGYRAPPSQITGGLGSPRKPKGGSGGWTIEEVQ